MIGNVQTSTLARDTLKLLWADVQAMGSPEKDDPRLAEAKARVRIRFYLIIGKLKQRRWQLQEKKAQAGTTTLPASPLRPVTRVLGFADDLMVTLSPAARTAPASTEIATSESSDDTTPVQSPTGSAWKRARSTPAAPVKSDSCKTEVRLVLGPLSENNLAGRECGATST